MRGEWAERETYETCQDAAAILSAAKQRVLGEIVERVLSPEPAARLFEDLERWRMVANAYDHVERAARVALGIDERGDPCLPS